MIANITDYFTYDLFAPSPLDILLGGLWSFATKNQMKQ